MKSNSVFHISEGVIKFLQVSDLQKKSISCVGIINVENQNDDQIVKTLTTFVKTNHLNFHDNRVTVLIPRSRIILRYLTIPSQKEDEIRSMIDLQVGSRIPYVKEEVEIDYQILSKTADGYSKVAVVVIPQEIAMRYWKIFSQAKIPIHQITISSIGLWLLYQQQPGLSNKLGAIFDLDVNHTEICLCYKQFWLNSREIPIGFDQMQQNGYGEILKQWELTQTHEKLSEPLESVFLVNSANRSYALGIEMAKLQGDVKIKEMPLTQTLTLNKGVQWPKLITDDGLSMASLVGIAFSDEIVPINLIPSSVRQAQTMLVYQRQLVLLGIWITMAFICFGLALGMGFLKKNIQLSQLQDQLHIAKHEAFGVENKLQKVYAIESIFKNRLIFSDLANEVYRLLPKDVYLVNITISNASSLSLEGVSSNSFEVNQFQKGMVDSKTFTNVNLDYVNKRVTQQGEVDYFKISCTLNGVSGQ